MTSQPSPPAADDIAETISACRASTFSVSLNRGTTMDNAGVRLMASGPGGFRVGDGRHQAVPPPAVPVMPRDHGITRADATVPLLDHFAPEIVRNGSGKMIVDDVMDLPEGESADIPQVRVVEQEAPHPREAVTPGRPIGDGE